MSEHGRPVWSSRAWVAATGVLVALTFVVLSISAGLGTIITTSILTAVTITAVLVTAWALLRTRRQRREHERRLEAWASQRAVHEERLHIARDLHDLASHGLALITLRAATANLSDDDDAAGRAQALEAIERVGREASSELRQMLTVLRGSSPVTTSPRPLDTLGDIPAIVESFRRTGGLMIDAEIEDVGPLAPSVQLTVCAVLREALANTARHAGPTTARVGVTRHRRTVIVEVRDAGPAASWNPPTCSGHGLLGLRERIAVHHGTLVAGPEERGFVLRAEVPTGSDAQQQ